MKKVLFFSILLFFAWGCHTESPKEKYPGFSPLGGDIYLKRITIGDGSEKPKTGDLLTLMVTFTDKNDSVLPYERYAGNGSIDTFTVGTGIGKGLEKLAAEACEGDSCVFLFPVKWAKENLEGLSLKGADDEMVKAALQVLDIKTAREISLEKKSYTLWCSEMEKDEKKLLADYLQKNKISVMPDEQGLYLIPVQTGTGRLTRKGDKVLLKYTARLLDGTEFDNTEKWEKPFEFTVGMQGELLPALEIAVGRMHQGEKVRLIAPSRLAFGEKGSSNGVVSPFKTITFDLELVTIK